MNKICQVVFLLGLVGSQPTLARADALISNPVAGISAPIATASPVATTAGTGASIACIDDSGQSTATDGSTCSAILPKCSDLKAGYEKQVKNFLSMKIWGYYQGKNIDLNSSGVSNGTANFVGPNLLYPICSIVGHKMQFTGTHPLKNGGFGLCDKTRATTNNAYANVGIEYATQTIGNKTSCGARPDALTGDMAITLKFAAGAGNRWDSWLIGAYPWLIRRYAYDVLNEIKPDLSNLTDVISDASVKADLATVNTKIGSYYSALSTDSKSVCDSAASDIVTKCTGGTMKVTDPGNRLCTLVKAQATLTAGALPNMIVKEIMARVQTNYDALFSNLMTFKTGSGAQLWGHCKDTGSLFRAGAKKKAMTASCLFDGANFYAYSDNNKPAIENDCTGSGSHVADYGFISRVSDGNVSSLGDPNNIGADKTLLVGFGGLVEKIIRHDICLQNTVSDVSICDTINIPDKPDGIQ